MAATTFEQIIANHGPMIGRLYGRNNTDFAVTEFIDTISAVGRQYATSTNSSLRSGSEFLLAAATDLVDAQYDPAKATDLIIRADRNLKFVADLHLA